MKSFRAILVFLVLVLLASALRFPLLSDRPMHADEAVHADKLGILLESGRYEYSTVDFHGPSLYFLSLLLTRLEGTRCYVELNEVQLRMVPALFGVALVAFHAFLIPLIGFRAAACAGLFAAVSPAGVFYSRYFIHETLLVFFTFCTLLSLFRYLQVRRPVWAFTTGFFLALMYATKETMIIAVACMIGAAIAVVLIERMQGDAGMALQPLVSWYHIWIALATAILISFFLFTSFLTNPRGIIDSFIAYRAYFERGAGINTFHVHPWYYYFHLLLYFHPEDGPVWTEAIIVLLAVLGVCAALAKKRVSGGQSKVLQFLSLYTVLMVVVYSLIPYKAPWNLLSLLHGMILLAGVGADWVLNIFRMARARQAIAVILCAAVIHLGWQAYAGSFRYNADPRNPWVYAHTGRDVYRIIRRVESLALAHPDRYSMPIQIISGENLWPLPWYLRRFSGVQWWNGVSETAPNAPLILITPDMEAALVRKLYDLPPPGQRELYVSIFDRYVELRPRVEVRGYCTRSLWEDSRQIEAAESVDPPERSGSK